MIKVIAYLLAFYTIVLSGFACQDKDRVFVQNLSQQQEITTGEDGCEAPVDLCSPFCVCACCASITLTGTASVPIKISLTFPVTTVLFSYCQPFSSGNSAGIWQPPKKFV
jgi:hypothetical protein